MIAERTYRYLGDKLTDPSLIGQPCTAVLRADGKCIVGRGAMLVHFPHDGTTRCVLRRRLRRIAAGSSLQGSSTESTL